METDSLEESNLSPEEIKRLQDERDRFHTILICSPVLIAVLRGPEFIYEFANPKYLKATGKTKKIIGKSMCDVFPELNDALVPVLQKVFHSGESFSQNEFHVRLDVNNDGNPEDFYFNFVYEPLKEAKQVTGILIHALDVTQHVLTRKKLEENEQRFRLAERAGNIGTFEWDVRTNEVTFSSHVEKIFGFKPGTIEGNYKTALDVTHPEDRERIAAENEKAIRTKSPLNITHRLLKPDGTIGWVNSRGEMVLDSEGNVEKVIGVIIDITDRIISEETLKETEEVIEGILNQTSVGVTQVDLGGNFQIVNAGFCKIVGRTEDELYNLTAFDITHPDDLDKSKRALKMKPGESLRFEKRYIKPDGSIAWVEINVSQLTGPNGEVKHLLAISHDITDRKEQEQSLKESEERFHNLADTAPIFMAMADETGNAVYFNRPWLEWTGKTMADMRGFGWLSTLHQEDAPKFENDFKHAFENQIPIKEQYRFKRADGEYRWMLAVGAPRFTPDGKFVGYFGTYTDFHELKATQDEKYMLAAILEASNDYVGLASLDQKWIYVNPSGLEMVGWESAGGHNLLHNIYPEDRPFAEDVLLPKLFEEGSFTHEIRFWNEKTGKPIWILWNGITIRDPETNEIIALATISPDISEQKSAQEKLAKAQYDTKVLMQKKDEFMAVASHELKTPLTTVKASLQLLERLTAESENPSVEIFINKAQKQADKLSSLVSDLLDVSKINAGKMEFAIQSFSIEEVIEDCLSFTKAESDHEIIVNGDQSIILRGDRNRLEQALCNLLSNAVKYSPDADKVIINIKKYDDTIKVSVTDFGVGIEESKIPFVFDRFFRVSENSNKFSGLGLGLYITSEIIKRHGGRIYVESTPGEGSTFSFSIPLDATQAIKTAGKSDAESRNDLK